MHPPTPHKKRKWNQFDFDKKENKQNGDNAFACLHIRHNSERSAEIDTLNPQQTARWEFQSRVYHLTVKHRYETQIKPCKIVRLHNNTSLHYFNA